MTEAKEPETDKRQPCGMCKHYRSDDKRCHDPMLAVAVLMDAADDGYCHHYEPREKQPGVFNVGDRVRYSGGSGTEGEVRRIGLPNDRIETAWDGCGIQDQPRSSLEHV